MKNEKEKYLPFALPMLKFIYTIPPPQFFDIIEDYSISIEAQKIRVKDDTDAYHQLLLCARSYPKEVPPFLIDVIEEVYGEEYKDDIGEWWDGETFDSDRYFTKEFIEKFNKADCDITNDDVVEWHRYRLAGSRLGYTIHNYSSVKNNASGYLNMYGSKCVPVMIPKSIITSLKNKNLTEYDKVKWATYMAIRSLAKNDVALTTSSIIMWRSVGAKNLQEYKDTQRDKRIKSITQKWHTRRQFHKVIADLLAHNLIKKVAYGNRIAVSTSITQPNEFAEAVATLIRKIYTKHNAHKVRQEEATIKSLLDEALNTH